MTSPSSGNLPLKAMLLMIGASALAILIFLWQMADGLGRLHSVNQHQQRLASLRSGLLYDHENMSVAAQLYTLSGHAEWRDHYRVAEGNLNRDLADIRLLTPETYAELNSDIETQSDRLTDMEGAAFLLMEQHYHMEGLDILSSDAYLHAKTSLGETLQKLSSTLDTLNTQHEEELRDMLRWRLVSQGAVLAALVLTWLVTIRLLLRWQKNASHATQGRHLAEQELDKQTLILKKIVENLPVGLFVKNVKYGYRWDIWNKKAEELFGLPTSKVLGTSDFDHFPEHEARFFRRTDEKVMAEGRVIDIAEEEVTSPRGTWLAHTIKVPIYDELGQPSMLLGIIEDITVKKQQADARLQAYAAELEQKNDELEEARTHAEAADRAKTQFLATMSHEIRTPLNGIIGTADLLGRTELSGKQDDYVRTIQKSGETLLYVINDILDLTKLEARQLGLENIAFDFSRTVEDVIDIHSANASKKELDLLLRYAPGTPERIHGDPGRLRQILNNLISNAIKFTESGHVLVDVDVVPGTLTPNHVSLRVAVRDTGIGIAADKQAHIFERFTQAEASTTRKYGGSGLGLAICKQLVELMGGEIGIESAPGQGSSFWFTLPSELDTQPVIPLDIAELAGKTVMVVDDNTVNLNILEELLAYWKCQCVRFEGGNAALAWLEQAGLAPDAAIIDHDMPEMSGADLGENLRLHPLTATMPMMVFSSRGMRGDTSFFEDKGFNGYLVKPSRPEEIRLMLAAILGNPAHERILTRHTLHEHNPHHEEQGLGTLNRLELNVMVVEDDPVNQKVVRLMLEEMGCTVQLASNGPVAVEMFTNATEGGEHFDLILMDMQMPGMDGPEATELIRAYEAKSGAKRTPVVALTANAMAEHRDLCLQAGMDGYMTKPISRAKLLEQIGQWVTDAVQLHAKDRANDKEQDAPSETSHLEGLEPSQMAELEGVFRDSVQECLGLLEQAQMFEDDEGWKRAAHRLKGAAASFGKEALRAACATAEYLPADQREQALAQIRKEAADIGIS